jgi:WD40 repeat protein
VNLLAVLKGHTSTVSCLACSLTPKRQQLFSGSADGTIRIWVWPEGNFAELNALQVGMPVHAIMVQDEWLVAGIGPREGLNMVRIWHMEGGAQQDLPGHDGPIYAIVQCNGMLCTAGHDASIRCWKMVRARSRSRRRALVVARAAIRSAALPCSPAALFARALPLLCCG